MTRRTRCRACGMVWGRCSPAARCERGRAAAPTRLVVDSTVGQAQWVWLLACKQPRLRACTACTYLSMLPCVAISRRDRLYGNARQACSHQHCSLLIGWRG